ncbi:uncharacterized protein LOC112688893 isoform X2 [Sipha flava]|uniref:Uncharacterized protein LOC112688893 isoform X2 n=1 Tax=Sipha flava TaxID=143950 RepID=A0A8B8G5V8_9HEMI|nr:uncharacterized protein LOC112688893 isoform X2 [Sipha flava]
MKCIKITKKHDLDTLDNSVPIPKQIAFNDYNKTERTVQVSVEFLENDNIEMFVPKDYNQTERTVQVIVESLENDNIEMLVLKGYCDLDNDPAFFG